MNPQRLMTRPATIIPRTPADTPDEYNDSALVDGDPIELDGSAGNGCYFEQTGESETTAGGQVEHAVGTVCLPPSIAFTAVDKIVIDDIAWEADGPPREAYHPRLRRITHLEARVRRAL